jgi:hypothetical protein
MKATRYLSQKEDRYLTQVHEKVGIDQPIELRTKAIKDLISEVNKFKEKGCDTSYYDNIITHYEKGILKDKGRKH